MLRKRGCLVSGMMLTLPVCHGDPSLAYASIRFRRAKCPAGLSPFVCRRSLATSPRTLALPRSSFLYSTVFSLSFTDEDLGSGVEYCLNAPPKLRLGDSSCYHYGTLPTLPVH